MDPTGAVVTAVLTSIALGFVARAWKKQAASSGTGELRHPTVLLLIALVTGVPFFGAAVASAFAVKANELWVPVLFLGFSLLGAYLLWEYFVVRYSLSDEGFSYRMIAAGRGDARWGDVTKVLWSQSAKWFRLELSDGRAVRISVLIIGLDRFAQALLRYSSQATIEPGTRGILEQCARGNPPSPWG